MHEFNNQTVYFVVPPTRPLSLSPSLHFCLCLFRLIPSRCFLNFRSKIDEWINVAGNGRCWPFVRRYKMPMSKERVIASKHLCSRFTQQHEVQMKRGFVGIWWWPLLAATTTTTHRYGMPIPNRVQTYKEYCWNDTNRSRSSIIMFMIQCQRRAPQQSNHIMRCCKCNKYWNEFFALSVYVCVSGIRVVILANRFISIIIIL